MNWSVIVSALLSGEVGERRNATRGRHCRRSLQRTRTQRQRRAVTWVVLSPVSRLPY